MLFILMINHLKKLILELTLRELLTSLTFTYNRDITYILNRENRFCRVAPINPQAHG